PQDPPEAAVASGRRTRPRARSGQGARMTALDRYTCEEVFRRLNDYLDRELSPAEMAMVKEHLDTCGQCASEHAFEASVLQELKSKLRRIDLPQSLLDKVGRSEEHTSELQSRVDLVCRLLLEKK